MAEQDMHQQFGNNLLLNVSPTLSLKLKEITFSDKNLMPWDKAWFEIVQKMRKALSLSVFKLDLFWIHPSMYIHTPLGLFLIAVSIKLDPYRKYG